MRSEQRTTVSIHARRTIVLCVAVLKNSCPESSGISVQIQMEWVSRMKWNHCPVSRGIGVQNALEYATKEAYGQLPLQDFNLLE